MVILVGATRDRQAVRFVLDVAPEKPAQGPQRVQLELRERIASAAGDVLKTQRDGVGRLDEHRFLEPVRPDQLDQAGTETDRDGTEGRLLESGIAKNVADD